MEHRKIEKKWQKRWESKGVFKTREDSSKDKYYVLEMFPYPSGKIHMGHVRNYSIGDSFARYKRMKGWNVLYPMGYDSFGLPAENAAIAQKTHPAKWTDKMMSEMTEQLKSLGLSYDWNREVQTCKADYYHWNQWIFLKMLERGIAYKKEAPINWCESCGTVLANEQVENGKCWRCKNPVSMKDLEQWFFKITDYAEELLSDIDKLEEWPDKVKTMQRNWIGRSEGTLINFKQKETNEDIKVFTTRPDTIYGATYMVYAPEHPKVSELVKGTKYEKDVKKFVDKVLLEEKFSRSAEDYTKEGMFIGKHAINPLTGEEIPIYIANFVLMDYGTGVIMAVPAHDQRDFEFAKKYKIPIKVVIQPERKKLNPEKMAEAYVGEGIIANSGKFDGKGSLEAIEAIATYIEKEKLGKKEVQYKLKDWLLSRQRYWGTPIPVIYCRKCGTVPVPEKDLPVELPLDVKFTGKGNPLTSNETFVKTKCPECKGSAKRETDTMDTFVDSSWYFYRYLDPRNSKEPFSKKSAKFWAPVDQYIGGIEHAIMHLLYARFFSKVLRDIGLCGVDEPFKRLLCQGMVIKDGAKMSKSLGNIVEPGEIIEKYGADTARTFMLFTALPEKELDWSDAGVESVYRFIVRVNSLVEKNLKKIKKGKYGELSSKDMHILAKTHRTIKTVSDNMENFQMNLAIGSLMSLVTELNKYSESANSAVFSDCVENMIKMFSLFAPHLSEELWEKIGNTKMLSEGSWPEASEEYLDEKMELGEDLLRNTASDMRKVMELVGKEPSKIRLFVAPEWKYLTYSEFKAGKDIGAMMKNSDLKKHAKELAKYVQRLQKRKFELPEVILSKEEVRKALEEGLEQLKTEFGCDIQLIDAEDSDNKKASTGDVMKPAIFVE